MRERARDKGRLQDIDIICSGALHYAATFFINRSITLSNTLHRTSLTEDQSVCKTASLLDFKTASPNIETAKPSTKLTFSSA